MQRAALPAATFSSLLYARPKALKNIFFCTCELQQHHQRLQTATATATLAGQR